MRVECNCKQDRSQLRGAHLKIITFFGAAVGITLAKRCGCKSGLDRGSLALLVSIECICNALQILNGAN